MRRGSRRGRTGKKDEMEGAAEGCEGGEEAQREKGEREGGERDAVVFISLPSRHSSLLTKVLFFLQKKTNNLCQK